MNKFSAILLGASFLLVTCKGTGEESETVGKDQLNLDRLEYTRLAKRLISDVVECTGVIDVPPNQREALYAPIGSNISDIKVLPGDLVKQGQLLYRLSHQDIIRIQEDYLIAYNDEKLYKTNLARKQQLYESNNLSERELRQVQHDYQVELANLESLAAQLKIIGLSTSRLIDEGIRPSINVRAPISGYISEVEAVSGSYVNMNSRIMTIIDDDHKHLELEVYTDRIAKVKEGQLVSFRLAGAETEHWGEIYLVGKEVDEETRTIDVHAHMNEELNLVVGSYLYATILTSADSLWSIPETALVSADNKKYVIVREGERLKAIEVQVGNTFNNFVAIKNFAALEEKEIVARDAYYHFEL